MRLIIQRVTVTRADPKNAEKGSQQIGINHYSQLLKWLKYHKKTEASRRLTYITLKFYANHKYSASGRGFPARDASA